MLLEATVAFVDGQPVAMIWHDTPLIDLDTCIVQYMQARFKLSPYPNAISAREAVRFVYPTAQFTSCYYEYPVNAEHESNKQCVPNKS